MGLDTQSYNAWRETAPEGYQDRLHLRVDMCNSRAETLKWLAEEYHGTRNIDVTVQIWNSSLHPKELNGTQYDILDAVPTPLEFSRLVRIGRPVLIKGKSCTHQHWDVYRRLEHRVIRVYHPGIRSKRCLVKAVDHRKNG